jgi:hypothetical protein
MFAEATLADLPLMSGAERTWFTDTAEHWGFAMEEFVEEVDVVDVVGQAAPQLDVVVVVLFEV